MSVPSTAIHASTQYRLSIPDRGVMPNILSRTLIQISAAGTTKGLTVREFEEKTKDLTNAERTKLKVQLYFDKVLRPDGL